jgi:hypothetical protein
VAGCIYRSWRPVSRRSPFLFCVHTLARMNPKVERFRFAMPAAPKVYGNHGAITIRRIRRLRSDFKAQAFCLEYDIHGGTFSEVENGTRDMPVPWLEWLGEYLGDPALVFVDVLARCGGQFAPLDEGTGELEQIAGEWRAVGGGK